MSMLGRPVNCADEAAVEVHLSGTVQGVGMRPLIYRLSNTHNLTGTVFNTGSEVTLNWYGKHSAIEQALTELQAKPPPGAQIRRVSTRPLISLQVPTTFSVSHSVNGTDNLALMPDRATCPQCLSDFKDPGNRRYQYPFTHCTACGPRYTIVDSLPWDRNNTSLRPFPLCSACNNEYRSAAARRFHAEPIACPKCGPKLYWRTAAGTSADALNPISRAAGALRSGDIVLIQGTGCFHLACDAHSSTAVEQLRQLKHRPHKPLALMVATLSDAHRYALISAAHERELSSPAAPIVLLQARATAPVSPLVAPALNRFGLMLAHSPLHHLLLSAFNGAIVLTSANPPGEPSLTDPIAAMNYADHHHLGMLWHNRRIAQRIDDSVVQVIVDKVQPLRRARGYAPAPITLPPGFAANNSIMALGGHQKNTICLLRSSAILSPWIGDLDSPAQRADYVRQLNRFAQLHQHQPVCIACDAHPDYATTQQAEQMRLKHGYELERVWHHHAHAASCLADNGRGLSSPPVLCICFDGMGLGSDGTFWGGEFLLVDYRDFQRLGHLRPYPLLGGDLASRQPWRNLLAQLFANELDTAPFPTLESRPVDVLKAQYIAGINTPATTSAGRLFDAVAAAVGIEQNEEEGSAAMRLEAQASQCDDNQSYTLTVDPSADIYQMSTAIMWQQLAADLADDISASVIARRFHRGLALGIAEMAEDLYRHTDDWVQPTVALSGGVFQNALLLEWGIQALQDRGFEVLTHQQVPANDGGLSLGQACIAAARHSSRKEVR